METTETFVQITAPRFCAAIILYRGSCVRAAPILKWTLGLSAADLSARFKHQGWKAIQRTVPLGGLVSLGGAEEED